MSWRGREGNGVCVCVCVCVCVYAHVLTHGGMCGVNAFVAHLSVHMNAG